MNSVSPASAPDRHKLIYMINIEPAGIVKGRCSIAGTYLSIYQNPNMDIKRRITPYFSSEAYVDINHPIMGMGTTWPHSRQVNAHIISDDWAADRTHGQGGGAHRAACHMATWHEHHVDSLVHTYFTLPLLLKLVELTQELLGFCGK